MINFRYKYVNLIGFWIQCTNYNKHVHCHTLTTDTNDIIMVFIKGRCVSSCWSFMVDTN